VCHHKARFLLRVPILSIITFQSFKWGSNMPFSSAQAILVFRGISITRLGLGEISLTTGKAFME
jgi:hypothetical protein